MRWTLILLVVSGICLSEAVKTGKHYGLHRREKLFRQNSGQQKLSPSASLVELKSALTTKQHHVTQQDICFQIKSAVTEPFVTHDAPCGQVGASVSGDTFLVAAGTSTLSTPDCALDGCTGDPNPCMTWYEVRDPGSDGTPFYIPEAFVNEVNCALVPSIVPANNDGGTSSSPTDSGTPDATDPADPNLGGSSSSTTTTGGSTPPDLLAVPVPVVEWAPLRLRADSQPGAKDGDGLCYFTTHFDAISLRDTACGKTIGTIGKDKKLIPLYEYQDMTATCDEFSAIPIAEQRANHERNEERRRQEATASGKPFEARGFQKKQPFRFAWWTKVQTDETPPREGWISTDRVIKKWCNESAAECQFVPNLSKMCYRVTGLNGNKYLKDSPCGTTLEAEGRQVIGKRHDIFVVVEGEAATKPDGCAGNWLHVSLSFGTGVQEGYITDTGVNRFGCGGDGWLSQVGPFTVRKVDHSLDKDGKSNTAAMSVHPNKFLLHTIEGAWPANGDYPSGTLDSKKYWPNFHLARDSTGQIVVAQYFSVYSSSRALSSRNGLGVVQVEIGARSDSPFTEKDWAIGLAVRHLYHAVATYTGTPICKDTRVNFIGNGAYGSGSVNRLSDADFSAVHGLVGHQHVTGDSHWDPGMIDPYKLM